MKNVGVGVIEELQQASGKRPIVSIQKRKTECAHNGMENDGLK